MVRIPLLGLCILFVLQFCDSQNVIDIQADTVFCSDHSCLFLKFSESEVFTCDIVKDLHGKNDHHYSLACLDVGPIKKFKYDKSYTNVQKITDLNQFMNWALSQRFSTTYRAQNCEISEIIQPVNDHYFVVFSHKKPMVTNKSSEYEETFYSFVPVRINNSFYGGVLIALADKNVKYALLPTENGQGILFNNTRKYIPTTESIELKTNPPFKKK